MSIAIMTSDHPIPALFLTFDAGIQQVTAVLKSCAMITSAILTPRCFLMVLRHLAIAWISPKQAVHCVWPNVVRSRMGCILQKFLACLWDGSKLLQPAHFHQHPPLNEAILAEDTPQPSYLATITPVACISDTHQACSEPRCAIISCS